MTDSDTRPKRKCPFCEPVPERILVKNNLAYAIWDINPVTKGHTLIIPFRHVPSFFETTPDERAAFNELAVIHHQSLEVRYHPAGYNFGVNVGEAAGQLIMHVHLHLIPRYRGDSGGLGSGLRHVIPKSCEYQKTLKEYNSG